MNIKKIKDHEIILHEAIEQLDNALGFGWKVTLRPNKNSGGDDQVIIYKMGPELYRADKIVEVQFKDQHIARNLGKFKGDDKVLIVAENILPKTKELLREQGIDYLDINGNCFINGTAEKENLIIRIEGRKNKEYQKEKFHRPFAKAGLKVTYLFLLQPEFINATYREIAAKAEVALGNIKHIIDGLIEDGFVLRKNKNEYAITNYDELLDKWARAYGEKLRPTLEVGTFRFLNPNDQIHWEEIEFDTKQTCWGGEPAAELWTNYLKPEIFTIYTDETKAELIRNYKLVPDPRGNINVYRKFWKPDTEIRTTPILTYADLVLTSDMRCLETAHMIFEKYINENVQRA
ncbi:hypothetical protein BH09BAC5_BH09BAC5_05240 [soil metagenome]